MSLLPLSDAVYYRTDFVNNRRTQIDDATGTKHLSIDGEGGLDIRYDIGSGNVKNFKINSAGVNWTDNTNNNTTSLERLSLVQQAFQAVELPPNATTLQINDTIVLTDGVNTNTISATSAGLANTLQEVLTAGSAANGGQILLRDLVNPSDQFIILDGNIREIACLDLLTPNNLTAGLSPSNLNITDGVSLDRSTISASLMRTTNLSTSTTTDIGIGYVNINDPTSGRSANLQGGSLSLTSTTTGGIANPLLVLQNNNNTAGGATFETYKNDLPTSTGGDVVGIWTASCNTNVGKTEIARISQIAYGVGASNNDGGIVLACKVNSSLAPTNFLACNGGAGAGEVQIFRPITNPTGDITISTTSSSGTGTITLAPNTGASVLIPSEAEPTTDFISINPQIGADAQRLLMTATNATTSFSNSISLNNSQYAPSIELKADFGSPERSITITADGNISRNQITAFDSQANEPLQIISTNPTGGGAIEFKPDDSSGSLIFTSSALEFNGSSADSGKRLKITLNGIPYYIPLESV